MKRPSHIIYRPMDWVCVCVYVCEMNSFFFLLESHCSKKSPSKRNEILPVVLFHISHFVRLSRLLRKYQVDFFVFFGFFCLFWSFFDF